MEEMEKDTFPAYRYWFDGQIIGDNLDIYINVVYGDPVVLAVGPEDDRWVAVISKDGVVQTKKFVLNEYEVGVDGVRPFSTYPEVVDESVQDDMEEHDSEFLPSPPGDETVVEGQIDPPRPPEDDSGDVQAENGYPGVDVDLGSDIESEGSIEDIPEGEPDF